MAVRVQVITNADNTAKAIRETPTAAFLTEARTVRGTVLEIVRIMRRPAVKPTGPIRWDSAKQRKAFFATDGFGGGIPHVRLNAYVDGWKSKEVRTNTVFEVSNIGHRSMHITGDIAGQYQSRIHVGRWTKVSAVVERLLAKLDKDIQKALNLIDKSIPYYKP
jgi:hypothetical protein